LDYDALRLFLHLSRTLHFGRTSRERHVSASALSRTVQRLEREVGWPLLERDRRTVRLTPAGERFVEHARDTIDRFDALRQRLRGKGATLAGSISIFASVTASQSFLPRILSSFRQRYPDIHIHLETGHAADAFEMLRRGAVDVAVAALPDRPPPAILARVILHTPLVFVAPAAPCEVARQASQRTIPWDELPLVLPAGGLVRAEADRWLRRKRVAPVIYGEVLGNEAALSLIALGCGVGLVPRIVLDKSALRADLRPLDVEPRPGELRVGFATLRRKLDSSPLVAAFWQAVDASGQDG
jgi:LysR family positive regulator for ilvC